MESGFAENDFLNPRRSRIPRIKYSMACAMPDIPGMGTFGMMLPGIEERPKMNAIHKMAGYQLRAKDAAWVFMLAPRVKCRRVEVLDRLRNASAKARR